MAKMVISVHYLFAACFLVALHEGGAQNDTSPFNGTTLFATSEVGFFSDSVQDLQVTFDAGVVPDAQYEVLSHCSNSTQYILAKMMKLFKFYTMCDDSASDPDIYRCIISKREEDYRLGAYNGIAPPCQSFSSGSIMNQLSTETVLRMIFQYPDLLEFFGGGIRDVAAGTCATISCSTSFTSFRLGFLWVSACSITPQLAEKLSTFMRQLASLRATCELSVSFHYPKFKQYVEFMGGDNREVPVGNSTVLSSDNDQSPSAPSPPAPKEGHGKAMQEIKAATGRERPIAKVSDDCMTDQDVGAEDDLVFRSTHSCARRETIPVGMSSSGSAKAGLFDENSPWLCAEVPMYKTLHYARQTSRLHMPKCYKSRSSSCAGYYPGTFYQLTRKMLSLEKLVWRNKNKGTPSEHEATASCSIVEDFMIEALGNHITAPGMLELVLRAKRSKRFIFGIAALAISVGNRRRIGRLESTVARMGDTIVANSEAIKQIGGTMSAFMQSQTAVNRKQQERTTALGNLLTSTIDRVDEKFGNIEQSLQAVSDVSGMSMGIDVALMDMQTDLERQLASATLDILGAIANTGQIAEFSATMRDLLIGRLPPSAVGPKDLERLLQKSEIQDYLANNKRQLTIDPTNPGDYYKKIEATGLIFTDGVTKRLLISFMIPTASKKRLMVLHDVRPLAQQKMKTTTNEYLTLFPNDEGQRFLIAVEQNSQRYARIPISNTDCDYSETTTCDIGIPSYPFPSTFLTVEACAIHAAVLGQGSMPSSCFDLWQGTGPKVISTYTEDSCIVISAPAHTASVICDDRSNEPIAREELSLITLCLTRDCWVQIDQVQIPGILDEPLNGTFYTPPSEPYITGLSEYQTAIARSRSLFTDSIARDRAALSLMPSLVKLPFLNISLIDEDALTKYKQATTASEQSILALEETERQGQLTLAKVGKDMDANIQEVKNIQKDLKGASDDDSLPMSVILILVCPLYALVGIALVMATYLCRAQITQKMMGEY